MSLKPRVASVAKLRIPEFIRVANPNFEALVENYYDWLHKTGSLDYIQNIVESRDIDLTSDLDHNINGLMSLLPSNLVIKNKAAFVKNLRSFFQSKGTEDSIAMFIQTLLNSNVYVEWNDKKVFKASSANYSRTATVATEGSIGDEILGAMLIQEEPAYAHALVESYVSTIVRGKTVNLINLNEKSVIGEFVPGATTKYLKNNIDRTAFYIYNYYTFLSYNTINKKIKIIVDEEPKYSTYVGQALHQIGTNNRAIISELISSEKDTMNRTILTFTISDVSGTFDSTSSLYLVPVVFELDYYTKYDWVSSTVSNAVTDIEIAYSSYGNKVGAPISFFSGNGVRLEARVGSITGGPIENVRVLTKGSGYQVGDKVSAINLNNYGSGFSGTVATIDGIGATAIPTMTCTGVFVRSVYDDTGIIVAQPANQLTQYLITEDGTRLSTSVPYSAGAVVTIDGGSRDMNVPPTTLTTADGTNWSIQSGGSYYTLPNTYDVTPTLLSGTGTGLRVSLMYSMSDVRIQNPGSCYNNGTTVTTIDGQSQNATFTPLIVNGVIKSNSIHVTSGGTGYYAGQSSISINSSTGTGASLIPVCDGSGHVTGVTVLDGGYGYAITDTITVLSSSPSASGAVVAWDVAGVYDGVLRSVTINDPGQYYPDITNTYFGTATAPTFSTTFLPAFTTQPTLTYSTSDGQITNVLIVDGGAGGTESSSGIPTTMTLNVNNTSKATFTSSVSSLGKISAIDIVNAGSGYTDPSEQVPLILTAPIGYGAILVPILDNTGAIIRVQVIDGGYNYVSGSSITVNQVGTTAATMTIVADNFQGAIQSVNVSYGGSGYKVGTAITVYGDGTGAQLTPVIDTGITDIVVVSGGGNYSNSTATVVDPTGTGAVIQLIPNSDGSINSFKIIDAGTGYTNPSISISGGGYGATWNIIQTRNLKSVLITDPGTGYSVAKAVVTGAGINAKIDVILDGKTGSVDTLNVNTGGSGYTATPTVTFTDVNGIGALSSVRIDNPGVGYQQIPLAKVTSTSGTGAQLLLTGKDVGRVNHVEIVNPGAAYDETPIPIFPLTAVVQAAAPFVLGEEVYIDRAPNMDEYLIIDEYGGRLIQEDMSLITKVEYNLLSDEYVGYTDNADPIGHTGPIVVHGHLLQEDNTSSLIIFQPKPSMVASVVEYDYARHLLTLKPYTDTYAFINETETVILDTFAKEGALLADTASKILNEDYSIVMLDTGLSSAQIISNSTSTFDTSTIENIISEDGSNFVTENSFSIAAGDTVIGTQSGAAASVLDTLSVTGICKQGGSHFSDRKFTDNIGFLNNPNAKLHDNARIQTHAYVLKTGYSSDSYMKFLKETVHPAGYAAFGDVLAESFIELPRIRNTTYLDRVKIFVVSTLLLLTKTHTPVLTQRNDWLDTMKFWLDASPVYDNFLLEDNSGSILRENNEKLKFRLQPTDRLIQNVANIATQWWSTSFELLTENNERIFQENTATERAAGILRDRVLLNIPDDSSSWYYNPFNILTEAGDYLVDDCATFAGSSGIDAFNPVGETNVNTIDNVITNPSQYNSFNTYSELRITT